MPDWGNHRVDDLLRSTGDVLVVSAAVLRAIFYDCHSAYTDACGIGSSLAPDRLGEPTSSFGCGAWDAQTRPRQFDRVFAILLVQPTRPESPNAPSVRSIQDH